MFLERVDCERARRIRRTWQYIGIATDFDNIRRVTAPRAFSVERVDRATFDGRDCIFDKAGFVQRIRVDHHLHIHVIGHRQAAINSTRCGAPIFVQFQRTRPRIHHFQEGGRLGRIALA